MRNENYDLFNADQRQTALGRKKASQVSVGELELNRMSPAFGGLVEATRQTLDLIGKNQYAK